MTPAELSRSLDVSRETCARLEAYIALLTRWNARINLISPATVDTVWARHVADSAQLFDLAPATATSWVDLGSGGGFPGLVVAALAAEKAPGLCITLVESNTRKAAFLAAAAREMGLAVTIEPRRAEALPTRPYDVVSARALAPLGRLCGVAHRFSGPGTVFLFPKGAGLDLELTAATAAWHIHAERIASRTDPEATVLRILELEPRL
ncbi:MAG: 16S rRNA (guanine(527)-N(7))-methyltransferase RsmG [Alphaproteobacteria bacterium]